jgi:hypothetical protein
VANTLKLFCQGAVVFIDWLEGPASTQQGHCNADSETGEADEESTECNGQQDAGDLTQNLTEMRVPKLASPCCAILDETSSTERPER